MPIVNRHGMRKWLLQLEETTEAKEDAEANEQDKDYPSEDRLDRLREEQELLQQIIGAINEYIDLEA